MATNAVATTDAPPRHHLSILDTVSSRYGMEARRFEMALRETVVPRETTPAQLAAFLVVAHEYGLNPLTKEIYAFENKDKRIVPLVSVDGWIRLINEHPKFDGVEFEDIPGADGKLLAIACTIYRKDRSRPIKVIEYLSECKRDTIPWNKSPARMLRHRALIQCGRYAFGFSLSYAEDDEHDIGRGAIDGGHLASMPTRSQFYDAGDDDHIDDVDPVSGEIISPNPPSEPLPPGEAAENSPPSAGSEAAVSGGDDEQGGAPDDMAIVADELIGKFNGAETVIDLRGRYADHEAEVEQMPEPHKGRVLAAYDERETQLKKGKK